MARGRIIDKRIGKSKKFAALKSERSRVLYLMIYPHLDVDGKFTGDPEEIKEDCCPKLKYTLTKIAESIIELADVGLLDLYEIDGEPIIQYKKFDHFQVGIRKDREAPSLFQNPDEVRSKSRVVPSLYLRLNSSLSLKKEGGDEKAALLSLWENEFEILWKEYHPDGKKNKQKSKIKFIALCKQAKLEEFKKGYSGYATFLEYKHKNENFKQGVKYFSTLCTDYPEYIQYYGHKVEANL